MKNDKLKASAGRVSGSVVTEKESPVEEQIRLLGNRVSAMDNKLNDLISKLRMVSTSIVHVDKEDDIGEDAADMSPIECSLLKISDSVLEQTRKIDMAISLLRLN